MPFIFQKLADPANKFDLSDVTFTVRDSDIDLESLVQEFGNFLLACGYIFAKIQVIYDEEIDETDQLEGER